MRCRVFGDRIVKVVDSIGRPPRQQLTATVDVTPDGRLTSDSQLAAKLAAIAELGRAIGLTRDSRPALASQVPERRITLADVNQRNAQFYKEGGIL